jgi:hypothetical protein
MFIYILIDLGWNGVQCVHCYKNLIKMNALKLMEEVKVLNLMMDPDVKRILMVGRPTPSLPWGRCIS